MEGRGDIKTIEMKKRREKNWQLMHLMKGSCWQMIAKFPKYTLFLREFALRATQNQLPMYVKTRTSEIQHRSEDDINENSKKDNYNWNQMERIVGQYLQQIFTRQHGFRHCVWTTKSQNRAKWRRRKHILLQNTGQTINE
ncbi:hypothetical protein RFI_31945 [Reticulomyxa filosa]|uniref:Uncharacterized protein n=1 Tax=Reticulomyxa filosa TaxID=46433 RepID=X6LVS4_RETFI|nr:hypothetical protein RFI_31945 [Reticulomyxa filosa]|eukprot:ETO05451.1 hypothetical protein RFI_31945 [Reticulomyxa filosa]